MNTVAADQAFYDKKAQLQKTCLKKVRFGARKQCLLSDTALRRKSRIINFR